MHCSSSDSDWNTPPFPEGAEALPASHDGMGKEDKNDLTPDAAFGKSRGSDWDSLTEEPC